MSKLILIIAVLVLCGCSEIVPNYKIEKATKVCSDKGGIYHLNTLITIDVRCNDGKLYSLNGE